VGQKYETNQSKSTCSYKMSRWNNTKIKKMKYYKVNMRCKIIEHAHIYQQMLIFIFTDGCLPIDFNSWKSVCKYVSANVHYMEE